jgi:hypothetical protein
VQDMSRRSLGRMGRIVDIFLGRVGRFNGAWIVVVVCFGDLGRCASAGRWGRVKLLCFEDGGDGWVHMYCFEVARLYYSVLQRVRLIL